MSESSYNSGSSGGSKSIYIRTGEDDILEATAGWQTGIFGVLYTVSKEKIPSIKFIAFRLMLEWLQLCLIAVNPQYGFNGIISRDNTAWYVISFVQLNQFMSGRGYTFFLVCLYIMVVGLMINVALCLYVAHSFQNNRFDAVWPIVLLRWYSLVFFQVLEVASITFFLMTLDCQYFQPPANSGTTAIGYNQEFNVYCWSMPHVVHAAVAAIALAVFIPMAMLFTMAEIDTNPTTRNPIAVSHSQVEVLCIAIKAVMTCASVFVTGIKWFSIVQLSLATWLVGLYIYWLPHTYSILNLVRSASFMSVWYTAVTLLLMAFMPGVDPSDATAVAAFQSSVTTAMWAGLVPAALLGAGLCWLRCRYFSVIVMRKFLHAPPGTKSKLIHEFTDPRQVEVMVRCCRKWQPGWAGVEDEDALDPGAVKKAETIIKAGMVQLPKHPYMIILYSSFLIDVLGSYQTGYNQLQDAKKTDPNFMERFSVFSREQEHTQKESSAQNGESAVDLVSYVEYQRNHRLVVKVHKEALTTMRVFWKILLQSRVKFNTLALGIKKMDAAVRQAERVYRQVLARHLNSATILRLYSHFLFDVKNDPWASARWLSESEKLDQEEDAHRDSEFTSFNLSSLGTGMRAFADVTKLKIREDRAVVIINGACTVQMTQGMGELFGYTKAKELHGKNVAEIIPPPFADQHNGYVRSHVTTGRHVLLDRTCELVALRKDRCALPVNLTVSHLSGVGEDSLFMGVLEPRVVCKLTASAWVLPTGVLAGVGPSFVDWFGFKATELMGSRLSAVLLDAGVIEGVMDDVRRVRAAAVPAAKDLKKETSLVQRRKRRSSIADYFSSAAAGPSHHDRDREDGDPSVSRRHDPSTPRTGPPEPPAPVSQDRKGRVTVELADERMVEVEYSVVGNDVIIPGLMMRHKYADSIKVDVTVQRTAYGQYQMYNLTFRRRETEQMLLVSDRQGRIRYASASLCELLGSSLEALQAESSANAIDAILPEPFAQLHYLFRMEAPTPRGGGGGAGPTRSCFSGVSVCLRSVPRSAVDPPRSLPVKLTVSHRELTSSDLVYSMLVQPLPVQQALDERRLRLTLDAAGRVVDVGASPASLFGFDPRLLRGKDVSSFLDVFSGVGGAEPPVKSMLVTLVERSATSPGTSWRVGVMDPTASKSTISKLGAIARAQVLQRTRPAVMTVQVRMPAAGAAARDDGSTRRSWGMLESKQCSSSGTRLDAALSGAELDSSAERLQRVDVDQLLSAQVGQLQQEVTPEAAAAAAAASDVRRSSGGWSVCSSRAPSAVVPAAQALQFDVELWCSALLCSVLELDAVGNIVGGGLVNPLCPPGLVLGAGRSSMSGALGALIPQLRGTSVQDLFAGKVGQASPPSPLRAASAGGGLKRKGANGLRLVDASRSNGTAVALSVPHLADHKPVELSLRAVWKIGSQSLAYVVLHAVNPACGREDFAEWLLTPHPWKGPSRQASTRSNDGAGQRPGTGCQSPSRLQPQFSARRQNSSGPRGLYSISLAATPQPTPADSSSPKRQASETPDVAAIADALDWALEEVARLNLEAGPVGPGLRRNVSLTKSSGGLELQGAAAPDRVAAAPPQPALPRACSSSPPRAGREPEGAGAAGAAAPQSHFEDWLEELESEELDEQLDDGGSGSDFCEAELQDTGNGQQQAEEEAQEAFTDYKRGKRFKKLYKFLSSTQVASTMSHFRFHMVLATLLLFAVHTACFAAMVSLLTGVQDSVQDLYSSALASRKVYEIAIDTRAIAIILANKTDPRQPGMDGPDALPSFVDDLDFVSTMFKTSHQGVYSGFRAFKRLPEAFGIRDLWDKPTINVSTFYDAVPAMIQNHTLMGLWDAGNLYLEKARSLWVYASTAINATDPDNIVVDITKADLRQRADYYFVMANGPGVLNRHYALTLDWLMQVTVKASNDVNTVHLIILVVEGLLLVGIAAAFVWKLTQRVTRMRYDMYSCFVQIPNGMIRSLAEKQISLDGEGEEDDDAELTVAPGVAPPHLKEPAAKLPGGTVSIRVPSRKKSLDGSYPEAKHSLSKGSFSGELVASGAKQGLWAKAAAFFSSGAGQQQQQEKALKKKLQASNRTAAWMILPFVLWSTVVVVMNAINYTMLEPMSDAISLLNIVCSVLIRHHVNFFFVMDFLADNSGLAATSFSHAPYLPQAAQDSTRARFAYELDLFEEEYKAMLYGGITLTGANATSPHFSMSSTGIATSDNAAKGILYSGHQCLCEDPANCQPTGSFYYAITQTGLDGLLKEYFTHFRSLVLSDSSAATIGAPAYSFIINLGQTDIEGGIVKMVQVYFNHLTMQYKSTETLQIIQLVVISVIAIAFIAFMVLPLIKEVWVETRRIAELLAQLPPEIDVEGIVSRTLASVKQPEIPEKKKTERSFKSSTSTAKLLPDAHDFGDAGQADHDADLMWAEAVPPGKLGASST